MRTTLLLALFLSSQAFAKDKAFMVFSDKAATKWNGYSAKQAPDEEPIIKSSYYEPQRGFTAHWYANKLLKKIAHKKEKVEEVRKPASEN